MGIDHRKYFIPEREANELIDLAEVKDGMLVLDPSAGTGMIAKKVATRYPNCKVSAIELNREYCAAYIRDGLLGVRLHAEQDFLDYSTDWKYDRIIANPPFTNDIWFLHLIKMYEHLVSGGKLVCVVPIQPIKEYNAAWLHTHGAFVSEMYHKRMTIHPMKNWTSNSDGSYTQIQVIKWIKE